MADLSNQQDQNTVALKHQSGSSCSSIVLLFLLLIFFDQSSFHIVPLLLFLRINVYLCYYTLIINYLVDIINHG